MLWPETHVTEANLTNIIVDLRKLLGKKAVQTGLEVWLSADAGGDGRCWDRSGGV